jgi:hypothetical protein
MSFTLLVSVIVPLLEFELFLNIGKNYLYLVDLELVSFYLLLDHANQIRRHSSGGSELFLVHLSHTHQGRISLSWLFTISVLQAGCRTHITNKNLKKQYSNQQN